jgi:phosphoglycolate phosphatase-like HAD superfamily hydrolase
VKRELFVKGKNMKLIIFDFDGVLRSGSWSIFYEAYNILVTAMGKDPASFFTDVASFKEWCNVDWHKNEMRILGGDTYAPNPEFNRIFHETCDPHLKLFPWVPNMLVHLSKKYTLAILSSSTKTSVGKELKELTQYFSFIIGAEEVHSLKPNPEGVRLILKLTETDANDAIMIGDMNVDFLAGKSAGVKTALVQWGMGDWEELQSLKPDFLFEKPEDLLSL